MRRVLLEEGNTRKKNLTILASVATGVIALGAPAAFAQGSGSDVAGGLEKLGAIGQTAKKQARSASKKSQQRTNNDIKRLGENVRDLRKRDDELSFTITSIVDTVTPILSSLGSAANSYANFQYGFVQLAFGGTNSPGAPQTYFMETPRLDPTGAQSTVTKEFAVLPFAAGGWTSGKLQLKVGVRSLNNPETLDKQSSVLCNAIARQGVNVGLSKKNTDLPAKNQLPFYFVQRSPFVPADPNEELASLVGQKASDKMIDFLDPVRAFGIDTSNPLNPGGLVTNPVTVTGGNVSVSLTCLTVSNKKLEDNGLTPPFK